jgi:stage III sporulation protein AG
MSEDNKKKFFGSILDKLKKIKHLDIILIVLFIAIILLIYFSSFSSSKAESSTDDDSTSAQQTTIESYTEELESKLVELISSIDGAGNVSVLVYFEEGIKTEIAYVEETKTSSDGTQVETKSPVLITNDDGTSQTVVLQEIMPTPQSVIVVASGAKDTNVKLEILRLVQAMFELSTSKIEIFA